MSTEKGAGDDYPVYINKDIKKVSEDDLKKALKEVNEKNAKEVLYKKEGEVRKYWGGQYGIEIKYNEEDVIKAMMEYSQQQLSEKDARIAGLEAEVTYWKSRYYASNKTLATENEKLKELVKELLPNSEYILERDTHYFGSESLTVKSTTKIIERAKLLIEPK